MSFMETSKLTVAQVVAGNHKFEDRDFFYDWFCKNDSLVRRGRKLMAKLRKIAKANETGKRFDADKTRVFFKNNCPAAYDGTYDSLSICQGQDGEVLYWVGFDVPYHGGEVMVTGKESGHKMPLAIGWDNVLAFFSSNKAWTKPEPTFAVGEEVVIDGSLYDNDAGIDRKVKKVAIVDPETLKVQLENDYRWFDMNGSYTSGSGRRAHTSRIEKKDAFLARLKAHRDAETDKEVTRKLANDLASKVSNLGWARGEDYEKAKAKLQAIAAILEFNLNK